MPRPRLPAKVKKAKGTFKASREAARPPDPPLGKIPEPPRSLSRVEAAAWRELAAEVMANECYSVADLTGFRVLVAGVAMLDDLPADAAPTAKALMLRTVSTLLASFGLTPASRGKVDRLPEIVPDELKEFGLRAIPGGKGKP